MTQIIGAILIGLIVDLINRDLARALEAQEREEQAQAEGKRWVQVHNVFIPQAG